MAELSQRIPPCSTTISTSFSGGILRMSTTPFGNPIDVYRDPETGNVHITTMK